MQLSEIRKQEDRECSGQDVCPSSLCTLGTFRHSARGSQGRKGLKVTPPASFAFCEFNRKLLKKEIHFLNQLVSQEGDTTLGASNAS